MPRSPDEAPSAHDRSGDALSNRTLRVLLAVAIAIQGFALLLYAVQRF